MTQDGVIEILRREPFRPFEVRLTNGERYEIRHPEFAAITKSNLVITNPDSERIVQCALFHIVAVEDLAVAS